MLQSTHAMYYGYSTILWEYKGLSFFKIGVLWSFAIFSEVLLFLKIDKYFKATLLFKTLLFCAIIAVVRWILTYLVESFYILLIVQTLHGVTFALTHYIMIFFINKKLRESSKLFIQSVYHTLTGGIFLTILTISCGHLISYTKGDEGYLLMTLLALFSLILVYYNRKILK
jgi:PPP family 3-phenylpropionic acid transporter